MPDADFIVDTSDGNVETHGLPVMMINGRAGNPTGIAVPDWSFLNWATSQCPGEASHLWVDFMTNTTNRYKLFRKDPVSFLQSKRNKMFWRGADMAGRGEVLKKILSSKPDSIPASFYDTEIMAWVNNRADGKNIARNCVSMNDHCQNRFLLHLHGLTSSNRIKYLLLCGSIVVMPKQEFEEWWFPAILPNNQMMLEVKSNSSDIHQKISELFSEDNEYVSDRMVMMSEKSLEFAATVFSEKSVDCYWATVINAGAKMWGTILNSKGRTVTEALKDEFVAFSDI